MFNNKFTDKLITLIQAVDTDESVHICKAAKIIYQTIKKDGLLHIFCTGHSHMMAEEMFYRAGGLVQVNPILEPMLMQHEGAVRSTRLERLSGFAKLIFDSSGIRAGEPLMVVSNSGINAVPIEMAELARQKGCPIIVVTSRVCANEPNQRTESGKYLFELADVVINNHTPIGDGIIDTEYGKIGAVSTITCSYIAQRLVIEIVSLYKRDGLVPAIYQSANIDGGDEHNEDIFNKFRERIRCLY